MLLRPSLALVLSASPLQKRFLSSFAGGLIRHNSVPVSKGRVTPTLDVPKEIPRPPYVHGAKDLPMDEILIHSKEDIDGIREACKAAARILSIAQGLIEPGVTTDSIDRYLHGEIIKMGAYPSPLGYMGFPKSVCTSINEVLCHGIPDSRPLQIGDIVNIDVTVYLNGFHGDNSRMYTVGEVDEDAAKLISVTRECLQAGIDICWPGQDFRSIGRVISGITKPHKYGLSTNMVGHGIGRSFHGSPYIFHCENDYDQGLMKPGMVFTVEPIVAEGSALGIEWEDGWTLATPDGGWAAQEEHTVLITEEGVEILTVDE